MANTLWEVIRVCLEYKLDEMVSDPDEFAEAAERENYPTIDEVRASIEAVNAWEAMTTDA